MFLSRDMEVTASFSKEGDQDEAEGELKDEEGAADAEEGIVIAENFARRGDFLPPIQVRKASLFAGRCSRTSRSRLMSVQLISPSSFENRMKRFLRMLQKVTSTILPIRIL